MTPVLNFTETLQARLGRWTAAALLVLGLHAGGGALALMQWSEDAPSDDVAGAITVELAPVASSIVRQEDEQPPGPEAEAAPPDPQASKRADLEVDKEIPKVEQSPAPAPDVLLPVPKPEVKKTEEEANQEEIRQEPKPTQAVQAPLTAVPPKVDAPQAAEAAVTALGRRAEAQRVQELWYNRLSAQLESNKRYPDQARARSEQGSVRVQFSLDRGGHLIEASVVHSSGSKLLDEEALALMKRVSPLPAPPEDWVGVALTLPINFKLK